MVLQGYDKYIKFIIKLLAVVAIFLAIYFSIRYLFPFVAPFLVAILIALINEPLIRLLENKLRFPRHLAAITSLLITVGIIGFIVVIVIVNMINELIVLQNNISHSISNSSDQIQQYFDKLANIYDTLPKTVVDAINEGVKSLAPKLEDIVTSIVNYVIGTVKSIPNILIFIIVTLLATYFISSDRREIRQFVYKQLPDSWSKKFPGIKENTFHALFGYFKAMLILMFFTFVEVSVGLMILGVNYAILIGLVVAICEVIPVLGTGIIMVPWIAWNLITGDTKLALGIAIIYIVGVIIRQVLEPKIVSSQIGLHPLVTLIAMYVGFSLFGVLGAIIGPMSVIILKNLQVSGAIRLWKE